MKKKLPTIKKSLIDFATKEDAKVMDKAFTKVALVGSAAIMGSAENGHAGFFSTHTNHSNHANTLTIPENDIMGENYFVKQDSKTHDDKLNIERSLYNPSEILKTVRVSNLPDGWNDADKEDSVDVPPKSTVAHHANHYNVIDNSSYKV